jgi:2'-5' RNA ligase
MRLFVAITLPDEQRARLASLGNGVAGARWVAPENLHLTLRFLGELDGAEASDVDEALASLRMPSFELQLCGVSHFGEGRKIRQLWAGVTPNPLLQRLHDKVEQAVIRSGLPPEPRKFKPHVTLARFKSNPGKGLQDYMAEHALFRTEPFQVESFTLYSSFLSASGAIYRAEADYPLESVPLERAAGDAS